MPLVRFRGGGEDGFIQFFRLTVSGAEFLSADGAVFFVGAPSASGDIAADDAFQRNGLGFFHEDGASGKVFLDGFENRGEF